jgi:uncharacterized protein
MSEMPILWEETVHGGASWSHVLKRGTALGITDVEGGANVGAMFYNFECLVERYNMADTLKAQHIARLTEGFVLYSDMGRVMCSVTKDTAGWHDPIGGCSNAAMVEAKYGVGRYQECRNDSHKNGLDSFLVEIGKWGMGPRDLMANVNFFSKVVVGDDGGMRLEAGSSEAGAYVELRSEMNVLVVLNTCQHPMETSSEYAPKPVKLTVKRVDGPGVADACRVSRAENARGFTLTERYFL